MLGLFGSVALVVALMRKNMTQDVAGAFFGVSQPTVSRRWDLLRPWIGEVLAEFVPDPRKAIGKATALLDGTVCPTWDWSAIPDLFSGKARYPGMNIQIATVRLRGTDEGERDSAIVVALTRFDGQPCVIAGQDRRRQSSSTPMGPAALREARRAMNLAKDLRLPFVSFIDTAGAELSAAAEEKAIAGEIARCIGTMVTMPVPTVSVLLGEGCGGGALALLPAQRVIATEHSWLSPLAPEGASAIVYGDAAHAAEMALSQHVGAVDLLRNGTVHAIVPELPVDEETAETFAHAIVAEVGAQLRELAAGANHLRTRVRVNVREQSQ